MTTNINIAELENLLNALSTATTSSVIQDIESQLEHYANSNSSLIDFLAILSQGHSPALHFFSLRVIGKWASERWSQVPDDKRYETFEIVFNYLVEHYKTSPIHITNRALKVIADIASKDWPGLIPDFLDRCVALVRDKNSMSLGIQILKILSEEYGDPSIRSGNIGRSKSLLNSYVPQIMELLFQILYNCGNDISILKEVLSTIYSYYTWVELPQILTLNNIELLLKCVSSGNESSLMAFDCINELMSRNFVPKDYQHFFLLIFNTIFSILQNITNSEENMAQVNTEFVTKFTLFSQLFVKNHLSRSSDFPVLDFLFLLYKYTFMQSDLDGYLECLSIWENFLDFLSLHDEDFNMKNIFYEAIIAFCEELVSRIQFANNYSKLSLFEDFKGMEGDESELDRYITSSLNLIPSITALYPKEVINRFGPIILNSIQQIVSENILSAVKNLMNDQDKQKFYYMIKDKKTILRLAGTIVETFVNDFEYYFEGAVTLLKSILELGSYFFQNEFHKYDISNTLVIEINGAMLSFSPFLGTLWYKISANKMSSDLANLFNELVSGMVYFIFNTFTQSSHDPSLLAASLHLKSLSIYLRCPHLIDIGHMRDLLQYTLDNSLNLEHNIRKQIYTSLVSIFLFPWVNVNAEQQNWDERSKSLEQIMTTIINPLIEDALNIQNNPSLITNSTVRNRLEMSFDVLTYITENTKEVTLNDKSILIFLYSLKNTYESSVSILSTLTQYKDVKLLLTLSNYFIALTERFASSFDSDIVVNIIDQYLLVLNNEMITNTISNNQSDGVDLIHKFLTLLRLLVAFPECPLLERIFCFVINNIYPHIERKLASPYIEEVFYKILGNIAINHFTFLSNNDYFIQLFKCVITSFERINLECYKYNLNLIKELKEKRNLCNNSSFLSNVYNPLLSQLFHTICSGWLDILYDEIVECIYIIVHGSGFDKFFDSFLNIYLNERFYTMDHQLINYLYQNFSRETDSPSFKSNISNFTNNIKIMLREGKISLK